MSEPTDPIAQLEALPVEDSPGHESFVLLDVSLRERILDALRAQRTEGRRCTCGPPAFAHQEHEAKCPKAPIERIEGRPPEAPSTSPHIEAVNYARSYVVPNHHSEDAWTPYERGQVRNVAQHYLAGYFAAQQQGTDALQYGIDSNLSDAIRELTEAQSQIETLTADIETYRTAFRREHAERERLFHKLAKAKLATEGRPALLEGEGVIKEHDTRGGTSDAVGRQDLPHPATGDSSETVEENPKSWMAWKRRAEAAEAQRDLLNDRLDELGGRSEGRATCQAIPVEDVPAWCKFKRAAN